MQSNHGIQNLKHPKRIRLSEHEILFSYVGRDDDSLRNDYLRRSVNTKKTLRHFKDIDARPVLDAAYPALRFFKDEAFIACNSRWKRDSEITLRIYQVKQFYAC